MTTTISGNIGDLAGVVNRAGELFDFGGSTAPSYGLALPLVATNVSRTTYAKLFAAIGTTWGAGDGSTTFGIPYCPANYAMVQANANVGTSTVGEVIAHTHSAFNNSVGSLASGPGYGTPGSSGSTGGSANLAAGMRVLKCIRIE